MNKAATLDMTEGKVIRVLLVFTIPIFISNLFQQFYNVVDVAVIGHILGDNALAAVGATSSIYSLVIGFINGMSNGFCIIIARYFPKICAIFNYPVHYNNRYSDDCLNTIFKTITSFAKHTC